MTVTNNAHEKITLSVVSHGQGRLIKTLFQNLKTHCPHDIEVVLTLNFPEELPFDPESMPFKVRVILNPKPKGFGDNHNAAFDSGCSNYFCVINPDIQLRGNPFPALIETLKNTQIGVVAPLILTSQNTIANSARKFPTVISIVWKIFCKKNLPDYVITDHIFFPDWVAGMFMLFRKNVFNEIRGFDKKYFLYYEDVDLCARLRLAGYLTALCPGVSAIHDAQQASHRSIRYLRWHLSSMLRFFFFRLIKESDAGETPRKSHPLDL